MAASLADCIGTQQASSAGNVALVSAEIAEPVQVGDCAPAGAAEPSEVASVSATTSSAHVSDGQDAANIVVGEVSHDISGFLKDLEVECERTLEVLPDAKNDCIQDPLLVAMADEKQRSLLRQARAESRMNAMDKQREVNTGYEADWREQVQKRKEAERRRIAEEEAAANVALQAFLVAERGKEREEEGTLLVVARRKWAASDQARQDARAQEAAAHEEGVRTWLDDEWLPRLETHRQQLRTDRLAEEQRKEELRQMLERERKALICEDAASAAFIGFAVAEAQRREALAQCGENMPPRAVVQAVYAAAEAERQHARASKAWRRQTEEDFLQQQAKKRDHDYSEWKREVRDYRCRQNRIEDRDMPTSSLEERQRLELQGRDYFKEKEVVTQSVLEDALQRATADVSRLKECGISPRSILEETRKRATSDMHQRAYCEPVKAEQDLWDALLAKNRRTRQQERTSRTPKWGVFAT